MPNTMDELLNVDETTEKTMTSRELAKVTGRRHDNLKTSIERMSDDLRELDKPLPKECDYKDNGRDCIEYILTIYQCELLALALDGIARIKVLDKLEELRNVKPLTFEQVMKNALLLADQKVKQLETKVEEDKPKVDFANTVANSSDVLLVREYSKVIYDEAGIDIGEKKLFKWFRNNGYLNKKNEPYQQYMKYFRVTESTYSSIFGTGINKTTKITGQGQLYFLQKLREDF